MSSIETFSRPGRFLLRREGRTQRGEERTFDAKLQSWYPELFNAVISELLRTVP